MSPLLYTRLTNEAKRRKQDVIDVVRRAVCLMLSEFEQLKDKPPRVQWMTAYKAPTHLWAFDNPTYDRIVKQSQIVGIKPPTFIRALIAACLPRLEKEFFNDKNNNP